MSWYKQHLNFPVLLQFNPKLQNPLLLDFIRVTGVIFLAFHHMAKIFP